MALPDLEAWAVFAKVTELRSFSAAAAELGLSKPTVSRLVSRLEQRLGTRLLHRTPRRLALTEAGQALAERARCLLADAEQAEVEALAQSSTPRGLLRLAAPMSFGLEYVAPLLPEFLRQWPQVSLELQLSDEVIDLVETGTDVAVRIGRLPDSSLRARRLCDIELKLVGSPAYFAEHGSPSHPSELADHCCLGYTYQAAPGLWRFQRAGAEEVAVRPRGRMRANNGDSLKPALCAGLGLALLPQFSIWRELADGRLSQTLTQWTIPSIGLHLVSPPGGPRPARVTALIDFLADRFQAPAWSSPQRVDGSQLSEAGIQ